MKRTVSAIAAAAILAAGVSCGPQKQTNINIAAGGTGGTYYPLAGAIAGIWTEGIRGVNAQAMITGASVANVRLLREGKADVIFIQNDIAFYAANGLEMFKDNAYPEMKGLATLYPETCQLIVAADSGIESVEGLKGKTIAVGATGSGVEANARQIMESSGIRYSDIVPEYLSFSEAATELKNGTIDAAFVTAGYPTSAIQDLANAKGIRLIGLDAGLVAELKKKFPFYTETVIPAATYKGQARDVATVAVKAMLASTGTLDPALAEKMLRLLYGNNAVLCAAHKMGARVELGSAKEGMSLLMHEGAVSFFNKPKN